MDSETLRCLRELDLSGVAITAAVDASGSLAKVGSEFAKLLAVSRERSLPRIHTVVVAEEQRKDIEAIDPALLADDPHAEFRVLCAASLRDAVISLRADAETRWGDAIDYRPELARHRDFVGRAWLRARVDAFLAGPGSGYLLLVGGPGVGKSAFAAQMWREGRRPAALHFVKRGMGDWDEPDALLRSLTAQVRRQHAIPTLPSDERRTVAGAFFSTLQQASRKLGEGQRVVVWLDGLDEAFGPTGRFAQVALPGILPRTLPEGVKFVLTSRPGEHLSWLAEASACERVDLEPVGSDNLDDIRAYLRAHNASRGLGLDADFIERLADASEGYFGVAVLYLRERPGLRADLDVWRRDPARIPAGLTGWLADQWAEVTRAAGRGRKPVREEVLKAILGLLETAREPLSRDHLVAFLSAAMRKRVGRAAGVQSIGFVPLADAAKSLDRVLKLTQEFFDPLDPAAGSAAPMRFFHTSFPEFIRRQLSEEERRDCQRVLGRGCAAWEGFRGPVRDYALRHRVEHLAAAGQWEGVAEAFADCEHAVERSERFGFPTVHADALLAARAPDAPSDWREGFAEWERFLRWRIERLRLFPVAYPQEVANEFLPGAPGPLADLFRQLRSWPCSGAGFWLGKCFLGPPSLALGGHTGPVISVSFSPSGRLVASGSDDRTVKVWEADTGWLVADCHGHTDVVDSVSFSPSGRLVVSGSHDGTLKVWEAQTGRLLAECHGHTDRVRSVSFSPSGRLVASGSWDNTVKVWEAETGRIIADCQGHTSLVVSVSFSGDGRLVASGADDGTVKVWDVGTGLLVADCQGHTGKVRSVSFSPSGMLVVSGGDDRRVDVWDAKTGRLIADCRGHTDGVRSVSFSPSGRLVASASDDGTVKVWEAETARLLADCHGHMGRVESVSFSRNGLLVASGSWDNKVKVWEAETGRLVADCPGHTGVVGSVSFSGDGRLLASGADDGMVKVWEAETGRLVADCQGHAREVRRVSFSPSGRLVASGSYDGTVKVCKAENGALVAECQGQIYTLSCLSFSPSGRLVASGNWQHTLAVRTADMGGLVGDRLGRKLGAMRVLFLRSGRLATSASGSGTVKVWEAETGRTVADCQGHTYTVTSVSFSPSGRLVASGSCDHTVKVWEMETGRLVADCQGHTHTVTSVSFSPMGRLVASGSHDSTAKVWEAETGRLIADCQGHTAWVESVSFSPSGRAVASGSLDGTVKVWEAETGRLVADCQGHTACVESVSFSPSGLLVVSGSSDRSVKVWEAATGRLVAACQGHTREVRSVSFSPSGRVVASGSEDRTVRVWDVQSGDCLTVLFFDREIQCVAFAAGSLPRLLVADAGGRAFGYEVVEAAALWDPR